MGAEPEFKNPPFPETDILPVEVIVPPINAAPATPRPPVTFNAPVVVEVLAVLFVMLVIPVADSVLNAPVLGVVAPIAVEFRPVEVKVPTTELPIAAVIVLLPVIDKKSNDPF